MTGVGRIVIVGGGIAGWTVATSLRAGAYDGEIVVIDREPVCYDRPPLSKTVLVDDAPLAALAFADPATAASQRIDVRCGRTATALDAATRTITLDDGTRVAGDAVVLATGAAARRPDFPGADLPGVVTLRTYADAVRVRALLGRRVAVVGAGLIGAEAAAALREAGSEVVLIDPNAVPGTRVFGPTLAAHLHAMHAAHGVDVRTGTVARVAQRADGLRLDLAAGESLDVDGVLVGTGITIDTSLASAAGIETAGGILVDDEGRTTVAGVFAVGDATRRRLSTGLAHPCGHWEAAELDGRAVAAAILGAAPAPRGADWFWSDRYGHHVEVVGDIASATGQEVVRPGQHPTVFRVDGGMLRGAGSVDDPMAVRAARRLIDRAVPVDPDRLADPDVPLRSLLPKPALSPS